MSSEIVCIEIIIWDWLSSVHKLMFNVVHTSVVFIYVYSFAVVNWCQCASDVSHCFTSRAISALNITSSGLRMCVPITRFNDLLFLDVPDLSVTVLLLCF